jgi:predicted Fe-Mo cluster-binding NifX family protein
MHFGHCETFALIDVDEETKQITNQAVVEAPPHQPGLLPSWLAAQGAKLIIAGGMGMRAIEMFAHQGIEVVIGAPPQTPEAIAGAYLEGTLKTGVNACDGGGGACGKHGAQNN